MPTRETGRKRGKSLSRDLAACTISCNNHYLFDLWAKPISVDNGKLMNYRTVPKTIAFKLSTCKVLCTGSTAVSSLTTLTALTPLTVISAAILRIRFTAAAGLTGILVFAALMRPAVCFSDSAPAPNAEQMDGAPAGSIVHPGDGAVMVYIPPGPFTMGNDSGWPEARPEHIVDLPGFYIDRYEVSIDMFRRFVDSGAYKNPGVLDGRRNPAKAVGW